MTTSDRPAAHTDRGFTLVELLITVVIIAILTAIAVPAYITVVSNAQSSAAKQDLASVKTAQSVGTSSNTIAGAGSRFLTGAQLKRQNYLAVPSTVVVAVPPDGSCYTALSKAENGKSFWQDSGTKAKEYLAGDTSSCTSVPLESNLVGNPSFETGIGKVSPFFPTPLAASTLETRSGSQSLRMDMATNSGTYGGWRGMFICPDAYVANTGDSIHVSQWVKAPSGLEMAIGVRTAGSGSGRGLGFQKSFGTGEWEELKASHTIVGEPAGYYCSVITVVEQIGVTDISTPLYAYADDGIMTVGPNSGYRDGNSAGWSWDGTADYSVSSRRIL